MGKSRKAVGSSSRITAVSYTHLDVYKRQQYAIPAIIAMTASSLYNMVDSIFIGHGVGAMAISGLALTFPLKMCIRDRYNMLKQHQICEVDEDSSLEFFTLLIEYLQKAGYEHYEKMCIRDRSGKQY